MKKNYHPDTLTESQIKEIWRNRVAAAKPKWWNGADPKPCFDYKAYLADENLLADCVVFTADNWNDLYMMDFREMTNAIKDDVFDSPAYRHIDAQKLAHTPYLYGYAPTDPDNPIYIYRSYNNDQTTICFYNDETSDAFVFQQYKNRGAVEAFYNAFDINVSIHLEEFTQLLIYLGFV